MDKELIEQVAAELNKHVNIPFLKEEQEQALIELIIGIIFSLLPATLDRIARKLP